MDESSDKPYPSSPGRAAGRSPCGPDARRAMRLRDWFGPFFVLAATLGGVWAAYHHVSRAAATAGFFAYMSAACTFLPLPTTWILLWAASPADGLGLSPLVAATLGAVATGLANMHDYYLVTFLHRFRPVRRVRSTRWYGRLAEWFHRAPLATLTAASLLPVPIDVVRLLAISERYSRWKFALGSVVGRWPRYFLLAYLAKRFSMGWEWIVGIGGAAAVLGMARAAGAWKKRLPEPSAAGNAWKEIEP